MDAGRSNPSQNNDPSPIWGVLFIWRQLKLEPNGSICPDSVFRNLTGIQAISSQGRLSVYSRGVLHIIP